MTKLKLPSKAALVERTGSPPEKWAGHCHQVSDALVDALEALGETAVVRRGYFLGETVPGAMFHGHFSQHSWVELPDCPPKQRVCDPTRHAFVGGPAWPLWVGPDDEYDIGGCRSQPPSGPPPVGGERTIRLTLTKATLYGIGLGFMLPPDALGDRLTLTPMEAHWLAHLPVKDATRFGALTHAQAAEVYQALIDAGRHGLIPMDRRQWILPDA